jgi:septum site-determining protein MinC
VASPAVDDPSNIGARERATHANRALNVLRGTPAGLEFVFAGRAFDEAWAEMQTRLAERPEFYRGSEATAVFDGAAPEDGDVKRFVEAIGAFGIALRGLYGTEETAALAARHDLLYLGEPPRPSVASLQRKRNIRAASVEDGHAQARSLTDNARSLDADFAGARADIARRRARGEASVPKPVFGPARAQESAPAPAAPAAPATLYHRGTLRGGQALQQLGTIVVAGDVNPGAELVATGDIIVFGALRGTAHAGAQGDPQARVLALELAPTQLRIATFIASGESGRHAREPEVAFVEGDRIAIAPYARVGVPR